jgi:hypothetical protein
MAIFHYSVKAINRSSGRSSVAAVAYRAGERLRDERTGEVYDYERREGVLHTEVFLPDGEKLGRSELWNLVEASEKRKDAKVAREIVVALPHELSHLDQLILIRGYAQDLSRRAGWAVDVAMHAPGRAGDQRNTHAHLLCSTRIVEQDEVGQYRMGAKTREWDVVSTGKELVKAERQEWERQVNAMLEIAQQAVRVDCRSYETQGIDQVPQVHLGISACQMERQGIETERGNRNREAKALNENLVQLSEVRAEREQTQALQRDVYRWERMDLKELEKEAEQLSRIPESLAYLEPEVKKAYQPLRTVSGHYWGYSWEQPRSEREDYEAYKAGKIGWLDESRQKEKEKAIESESTSLLWAQRYEKQWRERHPYKSMLFDMGVPNRELGELVGIRLSREADVAKTEQALSEFKSARSHAQKNLEQAIQKVLPQMEVEYVKRQARAAVLQPILKQKQEQAKMIENEREHQRQQERSLERGGGRGIGF